MAKSGRPKQPWLVPLLLLTAGALVSGIAYLGPGHPTSVDVWPHLARQAVVYDALKTGASPFWSFSFYCGFPMLRFYAPLFAFLGGTFAFVSGVGNVLTIKLLLFVLHLGSGLTMFLYLFRRTRRWWAGTLGTLVYLIVPWRIIHLNVLANYPQSLVYLLLPLVFLAFERTRDDPGPRSAALLALALGLTLLSHQLYALLAIVFLLLALGLPSGASKTLLSRRLKYLLASGVGAVLVAAFFLIPFLAEFRARLFPLPPLVRPSPELPVLLNPWSEPGGFAGAYLGLSCIALSLGSAVALVLSRRTRARSVWPDAGFVLSLILVFGPELLGTTANYLLLGTAGMRFLLFVVFFMGLLVAEGTALLENTGRLRPLARAFLFVAVAVTIAIDCLPQGMRTPGYHSAEPWFLDVRSDIYVGLSRDRPSRVLDLPNHRDRLDDPKRMEDFPGIGYVYGRMPTPFGPHYHQFAPRSMMYVQPWMNLVARDLGDGSDLVLSPKATIALALAGISHIITVPTPVRTDEEGTIGTVKQGIDWFTRFLAEGRDPPLVVGFTSRPLVLASNRLLPLPDNGTEKDRSTTVASDWLLMLEQTELDTANNVLGYIPVRGGTREQIPGPAALRVLEQNVKPSRVDLDFAVMTDCFVRLAVSYYPELRGRLDGRSIDFGETADHFTWFRCPAGRHDLKVDAPVGPLRVACGIVSLLALTGCVAALAVRRPRRQ